MLESRFQRDLIKKIERRFPGAIVMKNDPGYRQGFPDLVILFGRCWAVLEVKANSKAAQQPNQAYYIDTLNEMSYASFIFPENEEEVLHDLQHAFESGGAPRIP